MRPKGETPRIQRGVYRWKAVLTSPKEEAMDLEWHLRHNFYPPLDHLKPFAERALEMAHQGQIDQPVTMENGAILARGEEPVTAGQLIQELRLVS